MMHQHQLPPLAIEASAYEETAADAPRHPEGRGVSGRVQSAAEPRSNTRVRIQGWRDCNKS